MTKNQAAKLEGTQVQTATAGVPATTKKNAVDSVRDFITQQKSEFEKVLPAHITFEKFQRTVLTAVIASKDILDADRASLMLSCLKAATDGLLPDGRDAALVIFNAKGDNNNWIKKVQYMPMYAGILKKVRQSKELASVVTHVVYEKDHWKYILGDEEKIEHQPYTGTEERGPIVAAYCIAKLKDGSVIREVMTFQDIEKVRRSSKAGNDDKGQPKGIWKDWYEEMARKTVFRRTAKWLPQSIELVDRLFDGDTAMGNLPDSVPEEEAEGTAPDMNGTVIDGETGEVISEGSTLTQPDLKAEVERKNAEKKPDAATSEDGQRKLV